MQNNLESLLLKINAQADHVNYLAKLRKDKFLVEHTERLFELTNKACELVRNLKVFVQQDEITPEFGKFLNDNFEDLLA